MLDDAIPILRRNPLLISFSGSYLNGREDYRQDHFHLQSHPNETYSHTQRRTHIPIATLINVYESDMTRTTLWHYQTGKI